ASYIEMIFYKVFLKLGLIFISRIILNSDAFVEKITSGLAYSVIKQLKISSIFTESDIYYWGISLKVKKKFIVFMVIFLVPLPRPPLNTVLSSDRIDGHKKETGCFGMDSIESFVGQLAGPSMDFRQIFV
ncbi:hypothetical protein M8E35_18155, partial [Desulfosporosinus nitroreducens]